MKSIENLTEFVQSLVKGSFGIVIVTKTEPKMRKTNNPYFGRVRKITRYTNAAVGVSYSNTIENRVERATGEKIEYQAEKPKGMTFVVANLILVSDTNPDQHYLRFQRRKNTTVETLYELDGKVVESEEEVAAIKSFIPQRDTYCCKQAEAGVSEEDMVCPQSVKFENILSIKQGDKVWEA